MYNYKIWDRKSSINGVSCEEILENRRDIRDSGDDVFLIEDDYGLVSEIQFKKSIQSIYNMSNELTVEEVAQEYIRIKEEEEKIQAQNSIDTLEDMGNKISYLESENKALKEELTQIQTSIASLTSLIVTTLEEK